MYDGYDYISFGNYRVDINTINDKREHAIVNLKALAEALPHGAGIDSNWDITVHINGNLSVSNEFHCMDEGGCYDGWEPFSFRIFKATETKKIKLIGPCEGQFQVLHQKGDILCSGVRIRERHKSASGLRDYLNDTIHYAMKEVLDAANKDPGCKSGSKKGFSRRGN